MSLTINLKLRLTKITKVITVKYNTFEKAAFDEYLVASLVKRAGSESEAFDYIDDVTGDGSLNSHYKALYARTSTFDAALLDKIMTSSMYPREVIDSGNSYLYYPELDVSVFHGKMFRGELGGYPDLAKNILYISEDVTELTVCEKKSNNDPNNYPVSIADDGRMAVRIADKDAIVSAGLFDKIAIKEELSLDAYGGEVFKDPRGADWHVLYAQAYNSLFVNRAFFYSDGKHVRIKRGGLLCTELAAISGLIIYREREVRYSEAPELCREALACMGRLGLFDPNWRQTLYVMLQNVDTDTAAKFINTYLPRFIDKTSARLAIDMIRSKAVRAWKRDTLQLLLSYCDGNDYTEIYRLDSGLHYTLPQLLHIDRSMLSPEHAETVDNHYADVEAMKEDIKRIIGNVVTSGMRERSKKLQNDAEVKRFRKLCNELQGHEARDIDEAADDQLDRWHKSALELEALLPKIKRKLKE